MSLDLVQSLNSLAMGQAMLVAPALGDSYAGKTAGSIAALLFVLANDLDSRLARRAALSARLEALLADAPPAARDDPRLAAAIGEGGGFDRLMDALAALHAWADLHDRALAAGCRAFLLDWASSERLDIPDLPG